MHQSLFLTHSLEGALHHSTLVWVESLDTTFERKSLIFSLLIPFQDLILFYVPGGYGWLHEEWHRAILRLRGVRSYDEVYDFPLFRKYIAVSRVSDDALARMKKLYPLDFIRSFEAGVEGQFYLTEIVRDECLMNASPCVEELSQLWMNIVNSSLYITLSGTHYADRETEKMESREGSNIWKRDFAGFDFTSWVYHLFNPLEPYYALGVHPSGVGVRRYVKFSDLTVDERKFLQLQGILTWLNLISPQLLGITDWRGFNFYLTHYLTPWGYRVMGDFLFRRGRLFKLAVGANFNLSHIFPTVTLEVTNMKWNGAGIDLRLSGWIQPDYFYSGEGKSGGSLDLKFHLPVNDRMSMFLNLHAKTSGWEPAEEYLGDIFSTRLGCSF